MTRSWSGNYPGRAPVHGRPGSPDSRVWSREDLRDDPRGRDPQRQDRQVAPYSGVRAQGTGGWRMTTPEIGGETGTTTTQMTKRQGVKVPRGRTESKGSAVLNAVRDWYE